jgi:hypothetical protein
MKSKSKTQHAAGPDQFLPGFSDDELQPAAASGAPDAADALFQKSSSGWWVQRSEHQTLNAAGHPAGFRYKLMYRSQAFESGVGADVRRQFLAVADLLNRQQDPRPPQ